MKYKTIIFLIITALFLSSCSDKGRKDEAYCFTMVFEKKGATPCITMYCKTEDGQSENSLKDTQLSFSDVSYRQAFLKAENSDNEIYYSSTKSIYFSDDLSKKEVFDVVLLLLNQSKYQTSVYVYTPEGHQDKSIQDIHREANNVCKNEKINYSDLGNYTHFAKFLKEFDSEGIIND